MTLKCTTKFYAVISNGNTLKPVFIPFAILWLLSKPVPFSVSFVIYAYAYFVVQFKFYFPLFRVWLCMIMSLKQREITFKPR